MDALEQHAFSQGIFFRKCRKRRGDKLEGDEVFVTKYFGGFGSPSDTIGLRYDSYRNNLRRLKEILEEATTRWTADFLEQVVEFCSHARGSVDALGGLVTPIAFLITGMLANENRRLVATLLERLKIVSPHVAAVSASKYINIKAVFQSICQQLMCDKEHAESTLNSSMEDEVVNNLVHMKIPDRKRFSASELKSWYRAVPRPPIVITIEDADILPVEAVQDILMSFSCIEIPVVFIVGITKYSDSFDSYVPGKCPTTFVYKTFEMTPGEERLIEVLTKVLFPRNLSVQLSGRIIRYICKICTEEELSLTKLESILKFCYLEHYKLPESVLCEDITILREKVLGDKVPASFEATFSSRNTVEAAGARGSGDPQIPTVSSPRKMTRKSGLLCRSLEKNIVDFNSRRVEWNMGTNLLFCLLGGLPGAPVVLNSIPAIYASAWDGSIFKGAEYDHDGDSVFDKGMKMLDCMARPQLITRLENGTEILSGLTGFSEEVDTTNIQTLKRKLEDFIAELKNVTEAERKIKEGQEIGHGTTKKMKFKSQVEFLQSMKESVEGSGQVYPRLRETIVKYLVKSLKSLLKPLLEHPARKIFIYDNIDLITQVTSPRCARQIHASLVEPERYIERKDCVNGAALHTPSDTAIVYNLIVEQAMINVNLGVIFENFKYSVQDAALPSLNSKRSRGVCPSSSNDPSALLIRFRHALTELVHMGFIKKTKSRVHADEVTRLNFGLW